MNKREKNRFWFILILISLSRLPFIFHGYGSEEDAWAMPLVTERIATTGVYEVSRLPGHPFQELSYTLMWNSGSIAYNLLTVIISSIGIGCFMLALYRLSVKQWDWAGIGLAFTPIVYINCTNDMDYMWATGFLLIAFFYVISNRPLLAGLFIAMAIGCRITSGAMLLPLSILLWNITDKNQKIKQQLKLIFTTVLITLIIFIPVYSNYGFSFFTYYEHFPIPGFSKNFYKGTIAVWGTLGLLAILFAILYAVINKKQENIVVVNGKNINATFLNCCILVIILYSIAYIKMPLKAAFLIPIVPYVWAALSQYLPLRLYRTLVLLVLISSLGFGINLADPLRGSKKSILSFETQISDQKVAFDLLEGPVIADLTKRQLRTTYAKEVLRTTSTIQDSTYIIAGWWLADLLVLQRGNENKKVIFGYYTDEPLLKKYKDTGYKIFHLPQQDEFNDIRYNKKFTNSYSSLLKTEFSQNP